MRGRRFCLDRIALCLHALSDHRVVGPFLGVSRRTLQCHECCVLPFTIGDFGFEGLRVEVPFRIEMLANLTASGEEKRTRQYGTQYLRGAPASL